MSVSTDLAKVCAREKRDALMVSLLNAYEYGKILDKARDTQATVVANLEEQLSKLTAEAAQLDGGEK